MGAAAKWDKSPQTSLLLSLMRSRAHGIIIYIRVSSSLRSSVLWLSGYTYPPSTASGGRRSLACGCSMGTTSALWTGLGWCEVVLVPVFLWAVGRSEAPQKIKKKKKRENAVKWGWKVFRGAAVLETDRSRCCTSQTGCRDGGDTLFFLGSIWPLHAGRTPSPPENRAALFT